MRLMMMLILSMLLASNGYAGAINSIYDIVEVQRDAARIVSNLGLNCGTPNNYPVFVDEFKNFISGVSQFSTELFLQLGTAKNFPNVCNVLTQNQINSYQETSETTHDRKCVLRKWPFKGCLKYNNLTYDKPQATYWWPKYLIEVTEKGNDFHETFVEGNTILRANRSLSKGLMNLFDVGGVAKLAGLLTASGQLMKASKIGMNMGDTSNLGLGQAVALSPMEAMRITSSQSKNATTYEANIWPIVSSRSLAENLTVCGPQLAAMGKNPGGYSWPFKGVPMTCPVATSSDAYSYWDSGILDYLDPEAATQVLAASNPLSCGMAQGMEYLSAQGKFEGQKAGDQSEINNSIGGLGESLKKSISNCSWPILGIAEAIAKKALSSTETRKWSQVKCTMWGPIAPRSSILNYENDYSYANTALKFKLFSHELFGVPRGDQERWSLAYPWEGGAQEGGNSNAILSKINQFKNSYNEKFQKTMKEVSNDKIDLPSSNSNRSEGLFVVGDPRFINATTNSKYWSDRTKQISKELAYVGAMNASTAGLDTLSRGASWVAAETARYQQASSGNGNAISGNRRIFTIWEKITCVNPSTRIQESFPVHLNYYSNCRDAIKYEVYKYVQLKYLRKICNVLSQEEGAPWK